MAESIYALKPAWCGIHSAGLQPEQDFQSGNRATAFQAVAFTSEHLTNTLCGCELLICISERLRMDLLVRLRGSTLLEDSLQNDCTAKAGRVAEVADDGVAPSSYFRGLWGSRTSRRGNRLRLCQCSGSSLRLLRSEHGLRRNTRRGALCHVHWHMRPLHGRPPGCRRGALVILLTRALEPLLNQRQDQKRNDQ